MLFEACESMMHFWIWDVQLKDKDYLSNDLHVRNFFTSPRTSNLNGARSKLWCHNVIKLWRTNCANNRTMRPFVDNLPINQTKSDLGSNVKWTLLQPLAWACKYVFFPLFWCSNETELLFLQNASMKKVCAMHEICRYKYVVRSLYS